VSAAPPEWWVPHSRYNDVPEQELVSSDYCILSRSPEVGADLFHQAEDESLDFTCKVIRNMTRRHCSVDIAETSASS